MIEFRDFVYSISSLRYANELSQIRKDVLEKELFIYCSKNNITYKSSYFNMFYNFMKQYHDDKHINDNYITELKKIFNKMILSEKIKYILK